VDEEGAATSARNLFVLTSGFIPLARRPAQAVRQSSQFHTWICVKSTKRFVKAQDLFMVWQNVYFFAPLAVSPVRP